MIIRRFRSKDAAVVSELIVDNLKTVNIRDYPEELINALAAHKIPQQMLKSAAKCDAFVAADDGEILGIAMLDDDRITNVFTHTRIHGRGIGRSLITHIETLARNRRIPKLTVNSSITAVGFYAKCGYEVIREVRKSFRGIENTVVEMSKILDAPEAGDSH